MAKLIDKLRNLLSSTKATQPERGTEMSPLSPNDGMALNEEKIVHLMQLSEQTEEGHYSCAETYDLLDEYVEMVASNEEAELLMPIVKQHLDMCPDCKGEYQILLNILQSGPS